MAFECDPGVLYKGEEEEVFGFWGDGESQLKRAEGVGEGE